MKCEVVDCLPVHIREISTRLRALDAAEIQAAGMEPKAALWRSWKRSHYRRAFLVNGMVGAVGGCKGKLLDAVGEPWLLTSPEVEGAKLSFVKEARRELNSVLSVHSVLRNYVMARYTRAIGLLGFLGFAIGHMDEAVLVGKEPFLPFEMRR